MVYFGNAFSLQMIQRDVLEGGGSVSFRTVDLAVAAQAVREGAVIAIGHGETAERLSALLGVPIAVNRASVTLREGDVLYVAQYMGGRLPEGAVQLGGAPDAVPPILFIEVRLKPE